MTCCFFYFPPNRETYGIANENFAKEIKEDLQNKGYASDKCIIKRVYSNRLFYEIDCIICFIPFTNSAFSALCLSFVHCIEIF